jgi:ABC-type lipoprotein release transport system permease subunit
MLASLAWRNLARNLRRTVLTGAAVAFAVFLSTCMRGLQDGGYDQMIDQAVRSRLGHLQVHPEGYLAHPDPDRFIAESEPLVERIATVEGVAAVAPRALAEGVVARDNLIWQVELVGIDPEAEAGVSVIANRVLEGERSEQWCRDNLGKALRLFGNDQALFDRWCAAARRGRYLSGDDQQGLLIGAGVAKHLVVSVGDEVTVQVVRAVDQGGEGGRERGSISQRRLEVVGLVRTGNPEIDDSLVYLPLATLTEMLGTGGPNELVMVLDDIDTLEETRDSVACLVGGRPLEVHTWAERNPTLKSLIDTDSQMGVVMLAVLIFLVALGVINATLMSVLERTREFGIMLALGMRRLWVFGLVMTEVALLGLISVAIGSVLGGAFELYGRLHGWPLEWLTDADMSDLNMAGSVIDPVYHSGLEPVYGAIIVVGVYLLFLASGFFPALRASRLAPVDAMREQ